jgi:hypothetical protein
MQWKEHTKFSSNSLPNPTTTTNAIEEYERNNNGGEPQNFPKIKIQRIPSRRGKIDWYNTTRSKSPLYFPLKRCKDHGREGHRKLNKVNHGGLKTCSRLSQRIGNH